MTEPVLFPPKDPPPQPCEVEQPKGDDGPLPEPDPEIVGNDLEGRN